MTNALFRGRRIDTGEWVEGYLTKHIPSICFIIDPKLGSYPIWESKDLQSPKWFQVDPHTICQATGKEDDSPLGKMIFDGDRIATIDRSDDNDDLVVVAVVFWDRDSLCWMVSEEATGGTCPLSEWAEEIEVIGTIHDKEESGE